MCLFDPQWPTELFLLTHFMPQVSFDIPWKHQKTKDFQGASKETTGMKWVNQPSQLSLVVLIVTFDSSVISQLTFTYSKSTKKKKTLEKGVKYVQS